MRLIPDDTWAVLTIWMEARGEPDDGMTAVAEVIRNRTVRRYQSDGTVPSTCLRPYQFSSWNTGDPNRRLAAVLQDDDSLVVRCRRAWERAKAGTSLVGDAVLYFAPAVVAPPEWAARCTKLVTIGRHEFYSDP